MRNNKFDNLETWINAFLRDCRTRKLSPFTVEFYRAQLATFSAFCITQKVTEVTQITADLIRDYLDLLESTGHNGGGRHAKFRALRTFIHWWADEVEPENWKNPLLKVKPPKLKTDPIPGVPVDDVKAMIATCGADFFGVRDKAILFCLLDSGARVGEFTALNCDDIDPTDGAVIIHKGKGNKGRTVFLGKKARRALRAYLKLRSDDSPALWVTKDGERLRIGSLQDVLKRRAILAGVPVASPHDYRRSFALNMLRAGVDIYNLAKLMGHYDISVLRHYLALVEDDIRAAHEKGSPVDRLL